MTGWCSTGSTATVVLTNKTHTCPRATIGCRGAMEVISMRCNIRCNGKYCSGAPVRKVRGRGSFVGYMLCICSHCGQIVKMWKIVPRGPRKGAGSRER
jgi:hypothetical protein